MTPLDALIGGASEEDGRITGDAEGYRYENMRAFSPEDLATRTSQRAGPVRAPPEKDFVIATVQPHVFNVTIPLPPGSEGSARQLFGEKGGKKYQKIADAAADGSLEWRLPLLRGTYGLFVNGASRVVTVKGRGITDVS